MGMVVVRTGLRGAIVKVLIVEGNAALAGIWARHLERHGCEVTAVQDEDGAISTLRFEAVEVIVLNLVLGSGSALAVADFASYRHPMARVIFVTDTTFFSDGSIFALASNACAYMRTHTPPEDLAAMVIHYGAPRAGVPGGEAPRRG